MDSLQDTDHAWMHPGRDQQRYQDAQKLIAATFKRTCLMFRKFGPLMFCRKGGGRADYGIMCMAVTTTLAVAHSP